MADPVRIALAIFLFLHGVAHGVGFAAAFRLGDFKEKPVDTTILGGGVDVGLAGARSLGILWLLVGLAFAFTASVIWRDGSGWPGLTAVVAGVSLVMSVLGWPQARAGVFINLALLAGLVSSGRLG